MIKTVLITGGTDGIGLETAKMFATNGHNLIIHGRTEEKVEHTKKLLLDINSNISIETFVADFIITDEVVGLAKSIISKIENLDVLINNAGIFVVANSQTLNNDNLDIRFCVNTIAPYVLTNKLLPSMNEKSRVVNLASAAQESLDFDAINGGRKLSNDEAYAQSKLALIMWGMEMAEDKNVLPSIISVNPKSFLGSKMVLEAYGRKGFDLGIGADILYRAALSDEFANANGKYYDNDICRFVPPHPYAERKEHREKLINFLKKFL